MKQLLFALLIIPTFLFAKEEEDPKYLAGAVPEVNGKVIFSRNIQIPTLNQAEIFQKFTDWGNSTFKTEKSRIVYSDAKRGQLAIAGEEYLVFSHTFMTLDRSLLKYNLIIDCKDNEASLAVKQIRYEYYVAYQEEPIKYSAEDWIIDKYALNKKKDNLNRNNGKFRKSTIDYVDKLFDSAEIMLGIKEMTVDPMTGKTKTSSIETQTKEEVASSAQPSVQPQQQAELKQPIKGFVHFEADKIPATIIDMLPSNDIEIQSNNNDISDRKIMWKGIGSMFGKKIATISIAKDSNVYKTIASDSLYKLSFRKPNSAETEPWMIIECKKIGETAESDNVLLMGEITNVWIK